MDAWWDADSCFLGCPVSTPFVIVRHNLNSKSTTSGEIHPSIALKHGRILNFVPPHDGDGGEWKEWGRRRRRSYGTLWARQPSYGGAKALLYGKQPNPLNFAAASSLARTNASFFGSMDLISVNLHVHLYPVLTVGTKKGTSGFAHPIRGGWFECNKKNEGLGVNFQGLQRVKCISALSRILPSASQF